MTIGAWIPFADRAQHNSAGWIIDGNGCHIWTGFRSNDGYAYTDVTLPSGKRYHVGVYRIRYEREIGPIPDGMVMDHYVCNNGPGGCCNPRHCRPVSRRENSLRGDSFSSDNMARTHCPHGHPLEGDNLVPSALKRGNRTCLICSRERARKAYWRKHPKGTRGEDVATVNRAKSHCSKGHPLEPPNLVAAYLARGVRICRQCYNANARERHRAKREAEKGVREYGRSEQE